MSSLGCLDYIRARLKAKLYCSIDQHTKSVIHSIIQFPEGSLPVRYLGVPLITTRLYHNDYKCLVDKVKTRLSDWRNKSLSFSGRLQLILSVLSSMQIYWASIFVLPISITKEIEKLKSLASWNLALMAFHTWQIITNKDSLWVKWIHS